MAGSDWLQTSMVERNPPCPAGTVGRPGFSGSSAWRRKVESFLVNTYVYVISCPLELVKVGVASNPKQRVRNLQIGSPVALELAAQYATSDLPSARAVAAALNERFGDRRERGEWFRATPEEVRHALGDRSMIDLYRPSGGRGAGGGAGRC